MHVRTVLTGESHSERLSKTHSLRFTPPSVAPEPLSTRGLSFQAIGETSPGSAAGIHRQQQLDASYTVRLPSVPQH